MRRRKTAFEIGRKLKYTRTVIKTINKSDIIGCASKYCTNAWSEQTNEREAKRKAK